MWELKKKNSEYRLRRKPALLLYNTARVSVPREIRPWDGLIVSWWPQPPVPGPQALQCCRHYVHSCSLFSGPGRAGLGPLVTDPGPNAQVGPSAQGSPFQTAGLHRDTSLCAQFTNVVFVKDDNVNASCLLWDRPPPKKTFSSPSHEPYCGIQTKVEVN